MEGSGDESLSLIVQDSQLVLVSQDSKRPALCLSRTFPTTVSVAAVDLSKGDVYKNSIYGIIGILPLIGFEYLVVIIESESVGSIYNTPVYKVKQIDLIPIGKDSKFSTPQQRRDEEKYKELVALYECGLFYYSRSFDLSNSFQRLQKLYNGNLPFKHGSHPNLWNNIDDRFVWNSHLTNRLTSFSQQFGNWVLPLIQGFFESKKECSLQSKKFGFVLISRRSKKRAGTRFNSRGSDLEGNAANYVETEQILELPDGTISSFVQIRGSIPFHWNQDPTLAYEPSIKIDKSPASDVAFKKHFEEQTKTYGTVVVVNLLKVKGKENALNSEFDKKVSSMVGPNLGYSFFDLHHHCGTSKFEKLSILMDDLNSKKYPETVSYFQLKKGQIVSEQKGVFRTNCKDCLDRTNLVQGLLAENSLVQQLISLEIVKSKSEMQADKKFMFFFRNIWADNGDALSVFYAGTGAIRSDVTRFGKGTWVGLMNDGINSLTRYYLNNFQDGNKQNAMNLLTNEYEIIPNGSSPFNEPKTWWFVGMLLLLFKTFGPRRIQGVVDVFVVLFWVFLFLFLSFVLRVSRKVIVNLPTLVKSPSPASPDPSSSSSSSEPKKKKTD